MQRVGDRITSAALAATVGTLALVAAHCIGYQAVGLVRGGASHHAGHGHLLPLASGSFLLLVVVVLAFVVAGLRSTVAVRLDGRVVLAVQVGGYLALEAAERLVQGTAGGLTAEVVAGLVLQAPVALVVARLCRRGLTAVVRLLARRRRTAPAHPSSPDPVRPAPVHRPILLHWALAAARRGPPLASFAP